MFNCESSPKYTNLQANYDEFDILSLPTLFPHFLVLLKEPFLSALSMLPTPTIIANADQQRGFAISLAGVLLSTILRPILLLPWVLLRPSSFLWLLLTAKYVLSIRSLLQDLVFSPTCPNYEDNEACIKIINARQPIECTRNIDTHLLYRFENFIFFILFIYQRT